MTSGPQLLHGPSFSNTTKTGPEVVLNLSIISATSETKFPSLLNDNYSAYLKEKFGWVSWYLVGKFVRKDFCAWKLFDEIPDSSCYGVLHHDMCYYNGIPDKGGGSTFCKMQLKMVVAQTKLLRNKRHEVVKQMKRDIALLLQSDHDTIARIWVEQVFREQKLLAANKFIELFCELIVSRLFIITKQRECSLTLKEGMASLIFASSRCYEISELIAVKNISEEKYGKDFVYVAVDVCLRCDVNCMLWCESGHMQFVDSASVVVATAKSASNAMAAAQVANTDCNQEALQDTTLRILAFCALVSLLVGSNHMGKTTFLWHLADSPDIDIVSLKKVKEDSLLSLIVSLRSISEGRFQSLDQFLPCEYCISLIDNIESQVKLREEGYSQLFSEVHKFADVISEFNNMVSAIPSYQFIIKMLSDAGKLDKALNVVDTMLDDDGVELFNNPNKKAMLFLNFTSESSDAFKSTYREVAEKYKKEDISFLIGDLKVVVTESIQKDVKYEKYVLLEFYAPCCGHCKKLVPILDEVVVLYEKDSNVVIAKLRATANGVPSDFDVKYYHLPQHLQDQMLAHLCLNYRTDLEDLQQQEPLDVILQKIAPIDSYIFVTDVADLVVLKNIVEQGRGEHQSSDLENKNMECASWLLCARPLGMETERTIAEQIQGYIEPYAEKLLPDLHPMKKHVFSPALDFQETLLHSFRMPGNGWQTIKKAGVYALEHLAQFYEIIAYSDYSYMHVDPVIPVMERLDTKHCVTYKLGKAATIYQIAEETYTTQTAALETAMSTPVFVEGSLNPVCDWYQLLMWAVVYTADEDLESKTDTQTELHLMELDAHNFVKFKVQNSHYPSEPLQKESKFFF